MLTRLGPASAYWSFSDRKVFRRLSGSQGTGDPPLEGAGNLSISLLSGAPAGPRTERGAPGPSGAIRAVQEKTGAPLRDPGVGKGPFLDRKGWWGQGTMLLTVRTFRPWVSECGFGFRGAHVSGYLGTRRVQVSFSLRLMGVIESGFLQPCPRRGTWAAVPQAPQAHAPDHGVLGGPLGCRVRPGSGPGSLV